MAAPDTLIKSETPQQLTEAFEGNVGIRGTSQDPKEESVRLAHRGYAQQPGRGSSAWLGAGTAEEFRLRTPPRRPTCLPQWYALSVTSGVVLLLPRREMWRGREHATPGQRATPCGATT